MTTGRCMNNKRESQRRLMRDRLTELSEDLLDRVLIRLSLTDIHAIRGVCKTLSTCTKKNLFDRSLWGKNGLQTSAVLEPEFLLCSVAADEFNPNFLDQVSSTSQQPSFLPGCSSRFPTVANSNGQVLFSLLVSPNSKWRLFPASVILPSVQSFPLKLLSSSAGLVLIGQEADSADFVEYDVLSVVNPVTGLRKDICLPEKGYRARQVVRDDENDGRYMIVAEKIKTASDINLELLLYDSETKMWSTGGTLSTNIRCPLEFTAAACLHGALYCLACTQETAYMFQFDTVQGWHVSLVRVPHSLYPQKYQNRWMENPGSTLCKPHLFRYRSDLMIVGVTLYKYGTKSRWAESTSWYHPDDRRVLDNVAEEGVHLWKLDEQRMMWRHKMTMPGHMFDKTAETYNFLSSEDYLYVSAFLKPKESSRRFSCQLSNGYWDELPSIVLHSCDRPSSSSSAALTSTCIDNGLFVFEPRKDAKVG